MIKIGDKIIASRTVICDTHLSKGIGLRFKILRNNEAYIFPFKKPEKPLIDMVFVFYPIDVVFLDNKKKVVEIKERFLPFSVYMPKKECSFIIELGKGSVKKYNIRINDIMTF